MPDTLSAAAVASSQDERIRQRAYEIWEGEGRVGNPEDQWFRAQRELANQGQEHSAATGEVPDEGFTDWMIRAPDLTECIAPVEWPQTAKPRMASPRGVR